MIEFYRKNPTEYRPNYDIVEKFFEQSPKFRRLHLKFGKLGQLLFDGNIPVSQPKFSMTMTADETETEIVYDRLLRIWIKFDETMIPWTYSLAPPPSTVAQELDYFIRSKCLAKHVFVWSTGGPISQDLFGRVHNHQNQQNIERFANFEDSPSVLTPAKMHNGFLVVQNWNDPRENLFPF